MMPKKKRYMSVVVPCILILTLLFTLWESWHNLMQGRWLIALCFIVMWLVSTSGWITAMEKGDK